MFNLSPAVLPVAADLVGENLRAMGVLISAEVYGVCVASLIIMTTSLYAHPLVLVRVAGIAIVAGNLLATQLDQLHSLLMLRFVVGMLGDGPAYCAAMILIARQADPLRGFGLFAFVNMLLVALALKGIPLLSLELRWFALMGALSGLGVLMLAVGIGVTVGVSKPALGAWRDILNVTSIASGVCLFAMTLALGSIWAFSELLAQRAGLTGNASSSLLSVAILAQGVGSLVAGLTSSVGQVATRWGIFCGAQVIAFALMSGPSALSFVAGFLLWGTSWNFGLANALAFCASLRSGQQMMAVAPGLEAAGAATGPALVVVLVGMEAPTAAISVGAIGTLLAMTMLLFAALPRHRSTPRGV